MIEPGSLELEGHSLHHPRTEEKLNVFDWGYPGESIEHSTQENKIPVPFGRRRVGYILIGIGFRFTDEGVSMRRMLTSKWMLTAIFSGTNVKAYRQFTTGWHWGTVTKRANDQNTMWGCQRKTDNALIYKCHEPCESITLQNVLAEA
jgi:hypothetical protein